MKACLRADSQGMLMHWRCKESIILVVALSKGLIDTVTANGVLIAVVGNVAVLGVLIIGVIVALSKGLVVAFIANGIVIVDVSNVTLLGDSKSPPSLYFSMGHVSVR
jgi:hypothetical protein